MKEQSWNYEKKIDDRFLKDEFLLKIAVYLYHGMSYQKIADELYFSHSSIKNYVHYLYKKCGVSSKWALRDFMNAHYGNINLVSNEQIKKAVSYYI